MCFILNPLNDGSDTDEYWHVEAVGSYAACNILDPKGWSWVAVYGEGDRFFETYDEAVAYVCGRFPDAIHSNGYAEVVYKPSKEV